MPGRQATFSTCDSERSPRADGSRDSDANTTPCTRMFPWRGRTQRCADSRTRFTGGKDCCRAGAPITIRSGGARLPGKARGDLEVLLCKAVGIVARQLDDDLAPTHLQVGMM